MKSLVRSHQCFLARMQQCLGRAAHVARSQIQLQLCFSQNHLKPLMPMVIGEPQNHTFIGNGPTVQNIEKPFIPKTQQVINVTCTGSPNLPHWHLVWAWTNGKTCNLIFAITELKQHVLSLVQTTIGFGDPCRTGSCSP